MHTLNAEIEKNRFEEHLFIDFVKWICSEYKNFREWFSFCFAESEREKREGGTIEIIQVT